jgi:hypothetical protein
MLSSQVQASNLSSVHDSSSSKPLKHAKRLMHKAFHLSLTSAEFNDLKQGCMHAQSSSISLDEIVVDSMKTMDTRPKTEVEAEEASVNESIHSTILIEIPQAEPINDLLSNTPPHSEYEITFKKVECPICFEEKYTTLMVRLEVCRHRFCYDCFSNYLTVQITSRVSELHCPEHNCKLELTDSDIKRNITSAHYEEYQKIKILHQKDPSIRWCPLVDCRKMIKLEESQMFKPLQIRCECGQSICSSCGEKWHPNISCQQAINEDFQIFSNKNIRVKMCPKCTTKTEKVSGCNHMVCQQCKYEYCWRCLGEYKGIHVCGPERIGTRAFLGILLWNICSFFFIMLCSVPLLIFLGIFYSILLHVCALVIVPSAMVKTLLHYKENTGWCLSGISYIIGLPLFPFLFLGYLLLLVSPCIKQDLYLNVKKEIKRQFVILAPQLCSEGVGNRLEEIRIGMLFSCAFYFMLFLFILRAVI